ncbi:MAG: hypothetical protein AB7O37_13625 [Vicinamibacteria bacterium]
MTRLGLTAGDPAGIGPEIPLKGPPGRQALKLAGLAAELASP